MIKSILYQEYASVVQLSLPLFIVCASVQYHAPYLIYQPWFVIVWCVAMGVYIAYANYTNSRAQARGLKHMPTGEHMRTFHQAIMRCGLSPDRVAVRYAYTDDAVALTLFNTVVVDPMVWQEIDTDPEAIHAQTIITQYVIPGVSAYKKALHAKIKELVSVDAQNFIFKHELGHVARHYSCKRIVLHGTIGALATAAGFVTALAVVAPCGGLCAWLVGIVVAGAVDLILSYASNLFWKAGQEKNADMFACFYSTGKEIDAAADFFEQYETYAHEYRTAVGLALIPGILLTGHADGHTRAGYLRRYARTRIE